MKIETFAWDAAADPLSDRPLVPEHHSLAAVLDSFDPELVSSLYWRTGPRWGIEGRIQGDSLLFVPVRGQIHVRSGDRRDRAGPGQVVLFAEGLPQWVHYAAGHSELWVYAIHASYIDMLGRQAFDSFESIAPALPRAKQWHERLAQLTTLFNREREAGLSLGRVLLRALMADLVLAGAHLRSPAPRTDPRIVSVLTRRSGSSETTVAGLAKRAGLSTVQFRKLFGRAFGLTPKQYLCREHLRSAAELLRRTDAPVKTVASDCGFSSDHYFEQRFKKAYGITPSEYRARHRNSGI